MLLILISKVVAPTNALKLCFVDLERRVNGNKLNLTTSVDVFMAPTHRQDAVVVRIRICYRGQPGTLVYGKPGLVQKTKLHCILKRRSRVRKRNCA